MIKLFLSFCLFIFINIFFHASEFKGGYYKIVIKYVYHAYLIVDDGGQKVRFKCHLGTAGFDDHYPAVIGQGDLKLARIICTFDPNDIRNSYGGIFSRNLPKDTSGIYYGLTGICHQMANRLLYSSNEMMFPDWWIAPYIFYGLYGRKNIIKEIDPDKKYYWPEYLAASVLKNENIPVTDASIQAKVPEIKAAVQNIALKYPEKKDFILYEINNYNKPELEQSLSRIGLIFKQLGREGYYDERKAEIESVFRDLFDSVEELENEIQSNPERSYINMIKIHKAMSKVEKWFKGIIEDMINNQIVDADSIDAFKIKFKEVFGFPLEP